jgi:hypothetical protein
MQAFLAGTRDQNAEPAAARRYVSVDALRGFDMFWIIGATALVRAIRAADGNAFTDFLARQLVHSPWEGFTFYDLIFPLFVVISFFLNQAGQGSRPESGFVSALSKVHAVIRGRRFLLWRFFELVP